QLDIVLRSNCGSIATELVRDRHDTPEELCFDGFVGSGLSIGSAVLYRPRLSFCDFTELDLSRAQLFGPVLDNTILRYPRINLMTTGIQDGTLRAGENLIGLIVEDPSTIRGVHDPRTIARYLSKVGALLEGYESFDFVELDERNLARAAVLDRFLRYA